MESRLFTKTIFEFDIRNPLARLIDNNPNDSKHGIQHITCYNCIDLNEVHMANIRNRVYISGLVQGVFFRHHTNKMAQKFGVVGWVRNLPDSRVEVLVEGEPERVSNLINWLRKGPPMGKVNDIQIISEEPTGEFNDFEITHFRSTY